MRTLWLALVLVNVHALAHSIAAPVEVFRFELDGTEQHRPSWIVLLQSDGDGLYWGPDAVRANDGQHLHVSSATWLRVRAGAAAVQAGRCETKLKNIAKTGVKDAEYHPGSTPDTYASCSFNYSDDKNLMDATAAFESIAETMQSGARLELLHRYDRLGLDAEMDLLAAEAKDGRAIELQNIASVLSSIVDDDRVIDRARRKAARLLQDASPPPSASAASPR